MVDELYWVICKEICLLRQYLLLLNLTSIWGGWVQDLGNDRETAGRDMDKHQGRKKQGRSCFVSQSSWALSYLVFSCDGI